MNAEEARTLYLTTFNLKYSELIDKTIPILVEESIKDLKRCAQLDITSYPSELIQKLHDHLKIQNFSIRYNKTRNTYGHDKDYMIVGW